MNTLLSNDDVSHPTAFPDEQGFTKSFEINQTEDILNFYHQYGFVVVRNVVDSETQINDTVDEIWHYLTIHNKRIDRDDSSTWEDDLWPIYLGLKDGGFISHMADVSLKMSWQNRQHPNVVRLFQLILSRDDLWVKFDRYGMMRPTKGIKFKVIEDGVSKTILQDRPQWQSKSNWLHWDQNPWRYPDFMGVQGLLALSDTNPHTGGFHCVPGFTHRFKQWSIDNETNHRARGGLINVPVDDPIRQEIQQIHLRKGSFLVWDSRLPHGNFPNRSDQFRIVQYITFTPAREEDNNEVLDRIDTFRMRQLSEKIDEQMAEFPEPELTELGEKILGMRLWRSNATVSSSFD